MTKHSLQTNVWWKTLPVISFVVKIRCPWSEFVDSQHCRRLLASWEIYLRNGPLRYVPWIPLAPEPYLVCLNSKETVMEGVQPLLYWQNAKKSIKIQVCRVIQRPGIKWMLFLLVRRSTNIIVLTDAWNGWQNWTCNGTRWLSPEKNLGKYMEVGVDG